MTLQLVMMGDAGNLVRIRGFQRINSLSSTEFLQVKDDRSSTEVIAGQ